MKINWMRWYFHSKGRVSTRRWHFSWALINETQSQKMGERHPQHRKQHMQKPWWEERRAIIGDQNGGQGDPVSAVRYVGEKIQGVSRGLVVHSAFGYERGSTLVARYCFETWTEAPLILPLPCIFRHPITLSNCFQCVWPTRVEQADARSIVFEFQDTLLKPIAEVTGLKENML